MPITFDYPPAATPIGPGYSLFARSSFIGPLGSDPIWTLTLFAPGTPERTLFSQQFHPGLDQKTLPCVVGDLSVILQGITDQHPQVQPGTSITVEMLLSGPAGQVDSGRQTFTYDPTTKIAELLHTQLAANTGFTATDRADLQVVKQSTQVTFPATVTGLPDIVRGLGDFLTQPPGFLLTRGPSVFLTGSGSLDLPAGPIRVNAMGAVWQWFTVPAHYGKALGSSIEYSQRLLQLSIVKTDGRGNQYVDQVVDAHTDLQYLIWGLPLPEVVLYTVAPGVTVQYTWLQIA